MKRLLLPIPFLVKSRSEGGLLLLVFMGNRGKVTNTISFRPQLSTKAFSGNLEVLCKKASLEN